MKRRILVWLLALVMALEMIPMVVFAQGESADTEEDTPTVPDSNIGGTCGDDLIWELTGDGILSISGTGVMPDYYGVSAPWDGYNLDIQKVVLEDGVATVGVYAFDDCSNLTEVVIPASITTIGTRAFWRCHNLAAFSVSPDNSYFADIDGVLFNKSRTKLLQCPATRTGVYSIPDGVLTLGTDAFSCCVGLTDITIPDTVTVIGSYVFDSCIGLAEIAIPNSVTSIGPYAFYCCNGLTEMVIPESVTDIGNNAFCMCRSLESINIPEGINWLGMSAFAHCEKLNSIKIPDKVRGISSWMFAYCTSLTEIIIPDGITSIGYNAFLGCTGLKTVYNLSALDIEKGASTHGYVAYYADNVYNDTPCNVHGHTDAEGVCSRCGQSLTPNISSAQLVLGGVLELKVTVDLAGADCVLRATIGEDPTYQEVIASQNGSYTVKLPAHRMYEPVKLELVSGGEIVAAQTWTMDAYDAAVREEYEENTKLVTLLDTLSDYGKLANYFAAPTGSAPVSEQVAAVKRESVAPYKCAIPKSNVSLGGVVSLYLDDACDLTVKFNANAWVDEYSLLVNGEAVTVEKANGKVTYTIPELLPQQWSETFNIRVIDAQGTTVFEVNYSVLSYAYICLGRVQELQTGLNDLLKAMYLYAMAANAYQGT